MGEERERVCVEKESRDRVWKKKKRGIERESGKDCREGGERGRKL